MKKHFVYDLETLSNCFIACFSHYKEDRELTFVIHQSRNDYADLLNFLFDVKKEKGYFVSFNGLGFDSQILEFLMRNQRTLIDMDGSGLAQLIYAKSQEVIHKSNTKQFQEWAPWQLSIKNVDIFSLNNYQNPAKMSSLKWIQCGMDWHNVLDMPIHHTAEITEQDIPMVIEYCLNDVRSTKKLMQLNKEQINLRGALTVEYDLDLYSASEPRISKELFAHFLTEKMGIDKKELKKLGTHRTSIKVSDILLPYIKFNKQEFNMVLNNFRTLVIDPQKIKGAFKYSVAYKGIKIDLGVGGIHGFGKEGVYEAKEGRCIMTLDVQSYYPNIVIRNGLSPAHLPKQDFCEVYEWMFQERLKYPKKHPKNYVLKIALNSVFGLSMEPNSFIYDPQMGTQITINGQLMLCMLLEMLCERIPDSEPVMMNTDGFEIIIPEQYKPLYHEICKEWEKLTQLVLEHDEYSKLFAFDCNNYIAQYTNGKTKTKGRFEFEPHDKYDVTALHKNKSHLIVPKAIFHHLIHGTDPIDYLRNHRNIFDYCGFVRAKGAWKLQEYITGAEGIKTNELQKTLRYFISKSGHKITKVNKDDGREIQIEAGKPLCTVFNKYEEKRWEDYDIDDSYYLKQIHKELETLTPTKQQLELF